MGTRGHWKRATCSEIVELHDNDNNDDTHEYFMSFHFPLEVTGRGGGLLDLDVNVTENENVKV